MTPKQVPTARFRTACISRSGGQAINEDACAWRDGVWALADGLGGHGNGAEAAQRAAEAALAALAGITPTPAALHHAFAQAQAAVHVDQRARAPSRAVTMRTTLVLLASDGTMALWGHVGDSRLYGFRAGALYTQTYDHSVPQALANAGEIAPHAIRGHEDRNRLLRCLGSDGPIRPTVLDTTLPLAEGDAFLLCSDGFWEPVMEAEMVAALAATTDPQDWLAALERLLLERIGPDHDNYSALAIWVEAA